MQTKLELDIFAQDTILKRLQTSFEIETERVRLFGRDLITCLVIKLDDDIALRCSVNDGKIRVTVGDSVICIQRHEWKRNDLNTSYVIAWIDGYIRGYQQ